MTEYKRKGNKWTINELLQLQREYELLEWTVQQIAEKHQRSVTAILYRLEDEGFVNSFSNARGYNINLSEHYTSSFTSEIVLTPGDECGGDECGGDDDNYEYLCEDDDNSESNVNIDKTNVENYSTFNNRLKNVEESLMKIEDFLAAIYENTTKKNSDPNTGLQHF
jgi:hypothetical protein